MRPSPAVRPSPAMRPCPTCARGPAVPAAGGSGRVGQRDGGDVRAGGGRPRGVLGRAGQAAQLGDRADRGAGLEQPAVREVVRRRHPERGLQRLRPARRGRPRRPGRLLLRGRARRHPRDHVRAADRRGEAGGQRADRAGGEDRGPGGDLPADDPRGGGGDAGLRPDRRPAHGRVRRLLLRRAGLADPGLRGRGRDHRRRRLPPGRPVGAQAGRRRGPGQVPGRPRTCWSSGGPARTSR